MIPASNQHIAPALWPARTIPWRQARLRIAPSSWASQTASRLTQAAAADVDQVLGEQVVAQRHRAAAEPEQGEVRGLAGALAEGGVEAADLLGGVAARRRQDADPRPAAGALGRQPQHQLADRAVGRARGEVVAAEGEDAPRSAARRRSRAPSAAVEIASGSGRLAARPAASPR